MNVAGEFGIAGLEAETVGQMYVVIVDESLGDGDEGDVTGDAAVIEPIDADGPPSSVRVLATPYQRTTLETLTASY